MSLIRRCVCGNGVFRDTKKHHIPMKICLKCGVIHQNVKMTEKEYFAFYENDYHEKHQAQIKSIPYSERYEHDIKIAKLRLKKYASFIPARSKILDIGAGNGAFVDQARAEGHDAYGADFTNHPYIYKGSFDQLHFPTEFFDVITLHDVFEHLIDPAKSLQEIRRILKPGGRLVIDFPDYFKPEGRHHWRPIQHLWYFTEEGLIQFLESNHIGISEVDHPIPGKFVLYTYSKETVTSSKKVLLLPGMGDIFWSLTRFQNFLVQKQIKIPKTYIWNFDGRPRSHEFLQKFPFLKSAGYFNEGVDPKVLNETYLTDKKWFIENYKGFDYYLSVNGILVQGNPLERTHETNWDIPMFEPLEAKKFAKEFKSYHGEYLLGFFSSLGMFSRWVKNMSHENIYELLSQISRETQKKIILTGCEWDREFTQQIMNHDQGIGYLKSLVGQTSNDQILALMRESSGMIGWCGGNTVMSTVFKKPTIMFWNEEQFPKKDFYINSCYPGSHGKWYFPFTTEKYSFRETFDIARRIF